MNEERRRKEAERSFEAYSGVLDQLFDGVKSGKFKTRDPVSLWQAISAELTEDLGASRSKLCGLLAVAAVRTSEGKPSGTRDEE